MIALVSAAVVMQLTSVKAEKSAFDSGLERFRSTPDALLVDVRTEQEYSESHIPGSVNVPLQRIWDISLVAKDKSAPLFVYCRSGRRSGEAEAWLKKAGYTTVYNIGGIIDYTGKLES